MKPFNLEQAKAGAPVCTRNGRKARIICWDAKCGDFPIIALVSPLDPACYETTWKYTLDGRLNNMRRIDCEYDLFMAEEDRLVESNQGM